MPQPQQFPYQDGDVTVLGPEIFASKDGSVICWRSEKYLMAKHPADSRREALCAWLTANGINPEDVPQDADMTISEGTGGRFLCCEVFERTADGHLQLDERGDTAVRTVVAMPLKVEPPERWQPYQKPTRDQLLTTVERLHALHRRNENTGDCEHCSARDYPDYSVPWPCETVRTLTGEKQA